MYFDNISVCTDKLIPKNKSFKKRINLDKGRRKLDVNLNVWDFAF